MAVSIRLKIAVFVLLLIVFHEVEGRHLKPRRCKRSSSRHSSDHHDQIKNMSSVNNMEKVLGHDDHDSGASLQQQAQESGDNQNEHNIDDFRPTAPGHSPGVGHSIHN